MHNLDIMEGSTMTKKLIAITLFGLYIPCTTLPSEKYSLRDFNPEQDTQKIMEIFDQERQWLNRYSSSSYKDDLLNCQKPACNIKVLQENEKLAGYVMYKKNCLKQGDITQLAVSNNYRNKGYGKLLVTTAIEDLKSIDARSIHMACYADNASGLNLYKKIGFVKTYNNCDFVFLEYNPTYANTDAPNQFPTDIFRQPWDL